MLVGITGGIGTGKSTVAKIFATLGVPIYNADTATKKLINTNSQLINSITNHFGEAAYSRGLLNSKYIANIVFNNKTQLQVLNSIVHPYSIANATTWASQQTAPYCIKEAALLFETAAFHHVQYTIIVKAPLALRIQRVMQRDSLTAEDIQKKISTQMPEIIKQKLSDFIIINNEVELVIPQVLTLHNKLLLLAGSQY